MPVNVGGKCTALQAGILSFAVASIPIWPAFISLASLVPPGVSLIPTPVAVVDLALCVVAAIVTVALLARRGLLFPQLARPLGFYVAAWILASLLGLDPVTGLMMTLAILLGSVFHAAIEGWYERPRVASAIFGTFLLTGTLVSLLGIALVVIRRPVALYAMVHGRATATFVVPGEFAGYLLLLVPTAFGIALVARSRFLRGLGVVALISGLCALALTYSRAGFVGLGVGSIVLLYGLRREPGAKVGAGLLVVAAIAAALMLFRGHHNPSEDFERLPIWQAGIRTIELFPLTGVGPGAFRHVYPLLRPASGEPSAFHVHNVILTTFAEMGVLGLAALSYLWLRFIRAFREALREAPPENRMLALAMVTGLSATWAQGMFDFVQVIVLGCWLPFMALALSAARRGLPEHETQYRS